MNTKIVAHLTYPYERGEYFAIFAHSFNCSEENCAAHAITAELGQADISTLCINLSDFNHVDASHQSFMLSDYIQDLIMTYEYLSRNYETKILLIGHSIVGVAVLTASQHMPNVAAIATIAAPADPAHISHLFGVAQTESEEQDKVRLNVERALKVSLSHQLSYLNKPYLIVHSLADEVVDFDNAMDLFDAAREPKKLLPVDTLDHMMSCPSDAQNIGTEIASWALPFLKK
ncbi:alpha/beta hydrolase [uncultured Tateyamaria sp.]|uniref:alpha/beta hydrolase n=1 Tax=uncultured Tateyamaria sp. TaxID=455651 RepID=UPI00263430BE|nr:alpha/beta hydrolase [uncultured Tateyamaria sp.]